MCSEANGADAYFALQALGLAAVFWQHMSDVLLNFPFPLVWIPLLIAIAGVSCILCSLRFLATWKNTMRVPFRAWA